MHLLFHYKQRYIWNKYMHEKCGYNLNESTGEFDFENPTIKDELNNPNEPITVFGYLTQALKVRKEKNNGGCTLQSCDNIRGNGHILKKMLCSFISKIDVNLLDWVKKNVSFPNSMVDRITPATVDSDRELLEKIYGLKDDWPVVCEPFIQWVIEDDFIGGRPAWEKVGVQFVSDVVPYENMKLRLLNAGHMVVGILGALHGYDKIDEASSDEDFSVFLRSFMDIESTPMLAKLEGIDLDDYKDTLLSRFKNKNIKDHISRICLQSSAKMPKFVLPTLRAQLESTGIIQRGAFLIAAWCKYCNGVNDNGQTYEIEDDIPEILKEAAKQSLNDPLAFLRIESVFGELSKNEKFIESFTDSFAKIKGRKIKECVKEMNLL